MICLYSYILFDRSPLNWINFYLSQLMDYYGKIRLGIFLRDVLERVRDFKYILKIIHRKWRYNCLWSKFSRFLLTSHPQQQGPGSETCLRQEFTCSLHGFSLGTQASSHHPKSAKKKKKVRLISISKLSVGVNVSVNGGLSLYVSPVMNWWR